MTRFLRSPASLALLAVTLAAGCGPYPYDSHTLLRITFESDLAAGQADTLRVWFTTPAGTLLGEMQDLALAPPDFEEFPFALDAYAGDVVVPSALTVHAEALAGGTPLAAGSADTTLVTGPATLVTLLLVQLSPPAPTLEVPVTLTNQPTITVGGVSARGTVVRVSGGLATAESEPSDGATGAWSVEVSLQANVVNVLVAAALGVDGTPGAPSPNVSVTHDDIAPSAPLLGPLPGQTGDTSVIVTGSAEASASIDVAVAVAGDPTMTASASANADVNGNFAVAVALFIDEVSDLSVTATDAAGNTSDPALASVEHGTGFETPPTVNPPPPYVNTPTVLITGNTTPGATVEATNVTNGGANVTDVADGITGDFSLAVGLAPNTTNLINVHVLGSMAGVDVVVVHDDIPPDPPVVNALASPTGALDVTVTGVGETDADIELARTAPTMSPYMDTTLGGPTGDFVFTMVPLESNATNTISVTQTDRAGNPSVSATVVLVDQVSGMAATEPTITSPSDGLFTSSPMVSVTGVVTNPGVGVEIVVERGGVEIATNTTTVATGDFTVSVPLTLNITNDLEFFSRLGAVESLRRPFTITHDDIDPAAPNAALITASAGNCLALVASWVTVNGVAGSVEPFATVTLDSTIDTAVLMANSSGGFGGSVQVAALPCDDNVNVRATDAAGNTSLITTEPVD